MFHPSAAIKKSGALFALLFSLLIFMLVSPVFTVAQSPATVTGISGGWFHTCALLSDGRVQCLGRDDDGQRGSNDIINNYIPSFVDGISTATAISSGSYHTCVVLEDQTVKCWGKNTSGQIGDGSTNTAYTPVSVSGISNAVSVSASESHTCALLADQTIMCWGNNDYGKLGNRDPVYETKKTPVAVIGITNALEVSAGYRHTCALLADQTVKCWGWNSSGQLGNGTTTSSMIPVDVGGSSAQLTGVEGITAGWYHSCARLSNGKVNCWGGNTNGQLGHNQSSQTASSLPVEVAGITTALGISGGEVSHTCARLANGQLQCWGLNASGQLGDGSYTTAFAPVTVTGISTARTVGAASHHTCTVLQDDTVKCWGFNDGGQLGITGWSNVPVTVNGLGVEGADPTPTPTPEPTPSPTVTPTPTPGSLTLTNLQQFDEFQPREGRSHEAQVAQDFRNTLDIGEKTRRHGLVFRAQLDDPAHTGSVNLKLQIEIKPVDNLETADTNEFVAFDGITNLYTAPAVVSGAISEIVLKTHPYPNFDLNEGFYKWRARVIKEGSAEMSPWQDFANENESPDFIIDHSYRVAVLMAETTDELHNTSTINVPPCKLSASNHAPYAGYNRQYFADLMGCVENYYAEASMDSISIETDILEQTDANGNVVNGGWVSTGLPKADYLQQENAQEGWFIEDVFEAYRETERLIVNGDTDDYDMVVVMQAGRSNFAANRPDSDFDTEAGGYAEVFSDYNQRHIALVSAPDDGVGTMAHELAHLLGAKITPNSHGTPDLYNMGLNDKNDGLWELMAYGSRNEEARNPPHMGGYTKEFFGWLKEDIHPRSGYGLYSVRALPHLGFGENVIRYNLSDDTDPMSGNYYLFETRKRNLGTWENSFPDTNNQGDLLLYKVNTNFHDYEYDGTQEKRNISLAAVLDRGDQYYLDADNDLHFWRSSGSQEGENFNIQLEVQETDIRVYPITLNGAIIRPFSNTTLRNSYQEAGAQSAPPADSDPKLFENSYLSLPPSVARFPFKILKGIWDFTEEEFGIGRNAIVVVLFIILGIGVLFISIALFRRTKHGLLLGIFLIAFSGIFLAAHFHERYTFKKYLQKTIEGCEQDLQKGISGCAPPLDGRILPDTDLHAITPDGRHVGVNYDTGEFENEIAGSEVSGDLFNDHEWILVPENEVGVKYYVSSQDTADFLAVNPDIATTLTEADKTESYEIYAKSIDPASGIYRSEMQTVSLQPGEQGQHTVSGGQTPGISEPVIIPVGGLNDTAAPTVTTTVEGTPVPIYNPEFSYLPFPNAYLPGATLILNATDEAGGSGIDRKEYSLDSGFTWQPYTQSFILDQCGYHYVFFRAFDRAGNQSVSHSAYEYIMSATDAIPPVTSMVLTSGLSFATPVQSYQTGAKFALTANDNTCGSGGFVRQYSLDNGVTWQWYDEGTKLVFAQPGRFALQIKSSDRMGNWETPQEKTMIITDQADLAPPTSSAALSGTPVSGGYLPGATVTLAATDNSGGSGVDYVEYSLDNGSSWATYGAAIGFNQQGSRTLLYRSVDLVGNVEASNNLTITIIIPDTAAPTVPQALTGSAASTTQLNLSWSASTDNVGVTGYRLERCTGSTCTNFAQIATPTTTSYSDTGRTANTTYRYRVRAVDAAGNLSAYSTIKNLTTLTADTTKPSTPANLNGTVVSRSQLNLSWSASTDNVGVTGYRLERCTGSTCTNFGQIATPTGTTFSNTGLTANTTYRYRMRAVDAAGNLSAYSSIKNLTTLR